ncbi:MAG: hypothetical protein COT25_00140 [Candidatus Kerfeldbacteria bacterium CG08_land_8_20_14_0_20_42_7]|uniref:Uncharacterized protein n=1 Tax=Candidatus Kerfeldbacteria bacterium CG08_land_8_20_14_0_20_42_7 TaxID=2014245 RepID=A0A2H0YUL4_9BACT|nr:MAG: hypothetical protein COT25_00140 [Candidatus Kerfeldbacteria bacterium CG08_land_8_20_14_0_20_42_7]
MRRIERIKHIIFLLTEHALPSYTYWVATHVVAIWKRWCARKALPSFSFFPISEVDQLPGELIGGNQPQRKREDA